MAEQNIKMNVKTDTGYDTLYPQTKADIVGFNDTQSVVKGKTVQENLKNTANSLYHPNLLINGDFQCNQRGENSYSGSHQSYTYTVDMWRIVSTKEGSQIKCEIIPKGVKITNIGNAEMNFEQIVDFKLNGYMCNVKFNNLNGSGIIAIENDKDTWNSIPISNGVITLTSKANEKIVRCLVRLQPNSSVEIEYIDLFEGDVAYPHVKEDYTVALERCKNYFQYVIATVAPSYKYSTTKWKTIICFNPYFAFHPSITAGKAYGFDNTSNGMYIESKFIEQINNSKAIIDWTSPRPIHEERCDALWIELFVSCEPL